MRHDKKTMNYQRRVLALMGFLLPILSTLFGFIAYEKNGSEFWYSISAMFYSTSGIFMETTLGIFTFFLFTYLGYDIGDRATCKFSGTMAFGILLFPCKCAASGETTGVFNLPTNISNVIHCVIAALLFGSFAYMIGFRFTKTDKTLAYTRNKAKRDRIYVICTLVIILAMLNQVLTSVMGVKWFTIINETIMLWSFSFAWAVKADTFKKWRD